jgi:hypothetical protein
MFVRYDKKGNVIRNRVVCDCQKAIEEGEEILVEQNHKDEVDINKIIKRHGIDLVTKVGMMRSVEYQFDDVTGNDFQEAANILLKAQQGFDDLPSEVRKKFDHSPAKFLDFVQNPDNMPEMIEMGLALPPKVEAPIKVEVTNPEPVPETPTE